jgi:hypothetical protein
MVHKRRLHHLTRAPRRAVVLVFIILDLAGCATHGHAQERWIISPNRGGAEGAKANAQIHTLLNENAARRSETTANSSAIGALDDEVTALEAQVNTLQLEVADIEAHAKAALASCSGAGAVVQWDGLSWSCATESDPTVGEHAKASRTPPDCHDINGKLLWDGVLQQWHCVADQTATAGEPATEVDPKVGTLVNGRWCRSDGSQVICDVSTPTDTTVKPFARNDLPSCLSSDVLTSDGSNLSCVSKGGAVTDIVPDTFSFADTNNQAINTVVLSNTVTVSGFDVPLPMFVSGQGDPEFRAGTKPWVTNGFAYPGDSIQIRLRTSPNYTESRIATLYLSNTSVTWTVMTGAATSCTSVGVSFQGGICVGTGANALIAAPTNASGLAWGSSGIYRSLGDQSDGWGNTAILASFGAEAHPAAHYCANLTHGGYTDWYLPARYEVDQLITQKDHIGLAVGTYWTSNDVTATAAQSRMTNGSNGSGAKTITTHFVRCVRRAI